jgi:hypothetical protein
MELELHEIKLTPKSQRQNKAMGTLFNKVLMVNTNVATIR